MEALTIVVPAAGIGSRMGSEIPKQYLELAGATVLDKTVAALLQIPSVHRIVVGIRRDDQWWPQTAASQDPRVVSTDGGDERADTVLKALSYLLDTTADRESWVLVHDAARPCVRREDIERLIDTCVARNEGGILAVPVRDTMKLSNRNGAIESTCDRDRLWHALTPQMFRIGMLHDAIVKAQAAGFQVTDEASAVEFSGSHPLLVEGQGDNIKITRPADLALASHYLNNRGGI